VVGAVCGLAYARRKTHEFVSKRKAWVLTVEKPPLPVARNQQSYRAVLETFDYEVKFVPAASFTRAPPESDTVLIVPRPPESSSPKSSRPEVLRYLGAGGCPVVLRRPAGLADQAGLHLVGSPAHRDTSPMSSTGDVLVWHPESASSQFTPPGDRPGADGGHREQQVLGLFGGLRLGSATCTWRRRWTPTPAEGVSHYPYFPNTNERAFGISTSMRSPRLETYFDPGDRRAPTSTGWPRSEASGIRTVYAAAWTFYSKYRSTTASSCGPVIATASRCMPGSSCPHHAQDVGPASEWREEDGLRPRTARWAGALDELAEPGRYRAAMDWVKQVLTDYPWDGVNITELSISTRTRRDYLRPDRFHPMSSEVRANSGRRRGSIPSNCSPPIRPTIIRPTRPRSRDSCATARTWSPSGTARCRRNWSPCAATGLGSDCHDDGQPAQQVRASRALGVDSKRIVALMKDFQLTLQVEDPAEFWMKSPERYWAFAQDYRKLVKDPRRLMFDINVCRADVKTDSLPSATATGRNWRARWSPPRQGGFGPGGDLLENAFRPGLAVSCASC